MVVPAAKPSRAPESCWLAVESHGPGHERRGQDVVQLGDVIAGVRHEQVQCGHGHADFGIAEVAEADGEKPEHHGGVAEQRQRAFDGDPHAVNVRRLGLLDNRGGPVRHRVDRRRGVADHFLRHDRFADRHGDQDCEQRDAEPG